jgi:hypothetical protein
MNLDIIILSLVLLGFFFVGYALGSWFMKWLLKGDK